MSAKLRPRGEVLMMRKQVWPHRSWVWIRFSLCSPHRFPILSQILLTAHPCLSFSPSFLCPSSSSDNFLLRPCWNQHWEKWNSKSCPLLCSWETVLNREAQDQVGTPAPSRSSWAISNRWLKPSELELSISQIYCAGKWERTVEHIE